MARFNFEAAAAFAVQSAYGSYDSTLDGITSSLSGDPDGTDQGLLLGMANVGVGGVGMDLGMTREREEKPEVGTSFTRPLADLLSVGIDTFTFAFPFCGPRRTTTSTPVAADFAPLTGVDAILQGAGLLSGASGATHVAVFSGSVQPFSALVYINKIRLELLDCWTRSLSIVFEAGKIPVATATIAVGSIKDPTAIGFSEAAIPGTLAYGAQLTVSAPATKGVGNTWQDSKGFQTLTLAIDNTVDEIPDSNEPDGTFTDISGRTTKMSGTLFAAAADDIHEADQLFATQTSELDQLSFQVGTSASGSDIAEAVTVTAPQPKLVSYKPGEAGNKAAGEIELVLGHTTANTELSITWD